MNEYDKKTSGFRLYLIVWFALLILTALTVIVAGAGLGKHGALTSISIAFMKAGLILIFFMHLKSERFLIKVMLFLPILTIAVIIGLTFFDVWFRY